MLIEQGPGVVAKEAEPQRRFCLLIPGGSAIAEGLRPPLTGLVEEFGQGNVKIVDSILSPKSHWNAAKTEGKLLMEQLNDGAQVTVAVHSFGLPQLERAYRWINKQDPEFITQHAKDLDIRVDAGTGLFSGMRDSFRFLGQFSRFMLDEQGMSDDLLKGKFRKVPEMRGLVSLFTFPPKNIESDVLSSALRESLPHLSQQDPDNPLPEMDNENTRDYSTQFSEIDQSSLLHVDTSLKTAIDAHNAEEIKALIIERGLLTKEYVKKAYRGDYSDAFGDESIPPEERWMGAAFLGLLRTSKTAIYDTMLRGKPGSMVLDMERKGIKVGYYIRDFDIVVTRQEIENFYRVKTDGKMKPEMTVIPRASHMGPLATEPTMARRMVLYTKPDKREIANP